MIDVVPGLTHKLLLKKQPFTQFRIRLFNQVLYQLYIDNFLCTLFCNTYFEDRLVKINYLFLTMLLYKLIGYRVVSISQNIDFLVKQSPKLITVILDNLNNSLFVPIEGFLRKLQNYRVFITLLCMYLICQSFCKIYSLHIVKSS